MVKKFFALMLCLSLAVITVSGCAKKKAEQPAAEQVPVDTTAAPVDTTAVQ